MRIALLTDLNERIAPDSVADEAVLAFEIAESLADSAREVGGFALDLVARRGSWQGLPLISLELDDLPHSRDKSLDGFVRQEAAYCELILAGLLQDYHLVHCLAPIVTPLQLLSSMGTAIVQTLLVGDKHPASSL